MYIHTGSSDYISLNITPVYSPLETYRMPGSEAEYAPGNLTVGGLAEPPPVTDNWSSGQLISAFDT